MSAPAGGPWWRLLTPAHWRVFLLASLAWLFDCMDQQAFNLARDGAVEDLIADRSRATELASYTTSVFLVGWALGGLIFGALGDRFGRARMLALTVALYGLGTGLSSCVSHYAGFCASLFFTGLGVGGIFGLAVALVADTVADAARAPALGLLQSLSTWGNIVAALVGIGLGALAARHLLPFGLRFWQAIFVVGALPALGCAVVLSRLREPERWVRAREEGRARGVRFGSYGTLLRDPRWRRHAWLGLAFCCSGIIGLWGLGNFHPRIVRSIVAAHFAGAGLPADELASRTAHWISLGLLMQNLGAFCGMMTMAKLCEVKGRRFALGLGLTLSFLSTVLVFRFLRDFGQIYWMLPIMGFGQLGVFSVYAIYLPELFPMSLRSTGTSFCYNFGRLAAATAPFTIGQITRRLGGNIEGFRTAGLWVSLVLLVGIAVIPFLPETRDQPLPED